MNDLGERHQLLLGIRPVGQVGDGALFDALGHVREAWCDRPQPWAVVGDLVHRRHVHARDGRQGPQHGLSRPGRSPGRLPLPHHVRDLADRFFAVTHHEQVDEVGEGLGVESAVAPGDDQQVLRDPVGGPHRHPGEVDAVEDVCVDELGRQVEGQQVEVARRAVRVHREQGDAVSAHELLEVDPRGVRPLGDAVVALVEDLVEDLEALVGQAHLVGVGVDQQPGHPTAPVDRGAGAVLASDVAGGLLHLGQERLDPRPEGGHVGVQCRAGYTNRRMWTLSTRPMAAKEATVEEPP